MNSFLFLLFIFSYAKTQTPAKVLKIEGKQIETTSEFSSEGDLLCLSKNSDSEQYLLAQLKEASLRKNSFGFSLAYSSLTTGASKAVSSFSIELRYMKNWGRFELGPLLGYQTTDAPGEKTKTLTTDLGLQGDFNFRTNQSPHDWIPALGFEIVQSSSGESSDEDSSAPSGQKAWVGFVFKWFPTFYPLGVRSGLGYRFIKISSGGLSTTTTGPQLNSGFQFYF